MSRGAHDGGERGLLFLYFVLPVDGDEWELNGRGQRGTYLGPAGYAPHVVEAHYVHDSK